MKERITTLQAFKAMFEFLRNIYFREEHDDSGTFGSFLSEITMLKDGKTADPAMWDDWEDIVKEVLDEENENYVGGQLTILQAYKAMYKFLECAYIRNLCPVILGGILDKIRLRDNGIPGDASLWDEWLEWIKEVLEKENRK